MLIRNAKIGRSRSVSGRELLDEIRNEAVVCTALAGVALAAPLAAQDKPKIATVVKIAGIQWFNRMEEGVKQFAGDTGDDAFQVGPAQADPQQQVALIEDMIAQGVDALAVVPMSPEALEPVLGKAMEQGITVITHEAAAQKNTEVGPRGLPERGLRRQPDGASRPVHGRRGRVRRLRRLADQPDPQPVGRRGDRLPEGEVPEHEARRGQERDLRRPAEGLREGAGGAARLPERQGAAGLGLDRRRRHRPRHRGARARGQDLRLRHLAAVDRRTVHRDRRRRRHRLLGPGGRRLRDEQARRRW